MASLWSLVTAAKVFRPRRTMIAWFRGTVSPGLAFVITGIGRKELNCLKDWITGGSVAVMHFWKFARPILQAGQDHNDNGERRQETEKMTPSQTENGWYSNHIGGLAFEKRTSKWDLSSFSHTPFCPIQLDMTLIRQVTFLPRICPMHSPAPGASPQTGLVLAWQPPKGEKIMIGLDSRIGSGEPLGGKRYSRTITQTQTQTQTITL